MRGQPLSTITSSKTDFMSIILASYPSKLMIIIRGELELDSVMGIGQGGALH